MSSTPQHDNGIIRRDFINAYAEKWNATEEYTEGLMEHVEILAREHTLQTLYKKLCDAHMGMVLTHGAQVGQGLAAAIKEVHALLSEKPS